MSDGVEPPSAISSEQPPEKAGEASRSDVVRAFERYMIIPALCGNSFFYVQAFKAFRTQSAVDLSWIAFAVSLWALASWLAYGLVLRNKILIYANIIGVGGALMVLLTILLYG